MTDTPDIGLEKEKMNKLNKLLKKLLADEVVLTMKLRNYHWNVQGIYFTQLHELFEEQYEETFDIADEVAEYIRFYGGVSPGSLKEMIELTRLTETEGKLIDAKEMLKDLLNTHESIIKFLREDAAKAGSELGDPAVEDFMIGLVHKHQKMAWMIRVSIKE